MHARTSRRIVQRATAALFLLALALPLATHLVTRDDSRDVLDENRTPAPKPELPGELSDWFELPRELESYYRDFVRGRSWLLATQHLLRWRLFGATPVGSETLRGTDGWIFFTGNHALAQHRGKRAWTRAMVDRACEVLARRREQLAALGVRYLVVVAPDKMSVFPEALPEWTQPFADRAPLDQLLAAAAERGLSDILLDLRPVLRAQKGTLPIYYARGTHWTALGAYHGYTAIAERLAGPIWPPAGDGDTVLRLDPEEVALVYDNTDSWGVAWHLRGELGNWGCRIETPELLEARSRRRWWPRGVHRQAAPDQLHISPRRAGSRLLVLHDSFWEALAPFLTNHFASTATSWTYEFDPRLAEAFGAQVVLQLCVERQLWTLFDDRFVEPRASSWLVGAPAAGVFRNPRWGEVRITAAGPRALEFEGDRTGRFRATRAEDVLYTGRSRTLGDLRLTVARENGVKLLVLRTTTSEQAFSFLASTPGTPTDPRLTPWVGRYEGEGLEFDIAAEGNSLWAFDAFGELSHELTQLEWGSNGLVAIDPEQPGLQWHFATAGAKRTTLRIVAIAPGEPSAELERRTADPR